MPEDTDNLMNSSKETKQPEKNVSENDQIKIEGDKDTLVESESDLDVKTDSLENLNPDVNEHPKSSKQNSEKEDSFINSEDEIELDDKNNPKAESSSLTEESNEENDCFKDLNDNKKSIETQVIAKYLKNLQIQIFGYDKEKEEKFEDPTHPFPKEISTLNHINFKTEIRQKYNQLKKESVLILSGLDANGNLKIAKEFVLLAEKESYECRALTFEGINSQGTDLHLETFTKYKIGKASKVLIIVNVTSQSFFNTLVCNNEMHINIVKEGLRNQDTIVLCIVSSIDYTNQLTSIQYSFSIWKLSFLDTVLLPVFGDSSTDIKNKILKQRKHGLWDTIKDENDESFLYNHISTYLNQGIQKFKEEIDIREKNLKTSSTEFYRKIKKIEAKELFEQADELKSIIIYIATFFENLTPHEFEIILQLLVKEKEQEIEVKKNKVSKKGKTLKKVIYENQLFFDLWKKSSDKLLNECKLKAIQDNEGLWIIGYEEPFLREKMKNFLESERPMFLVNQYQEFQKHGFIFEPLLSERIFKNIVHVSVRMILTNPGHFGVNWLFNLLLGMQNILIVEEREIQNEEQLFSMLIEEIQKKEIRNHFYFRLTELIREILKYPKLHHVIKEFLLILLKKKYFEVTLEIITEILRRIGVIQEINLFFYLKRIVEEGDNNIKEKVYRFLYNYSYSGSTRFFDVIELIKDWFPEDTVPPDKYTSANKYALKFLIFYLVNSSNQFKVKGYGKWPTNYQLFFNLYKDDDIKNEFIFILGVLFNEGLKEIVSEERLKTSFNEIVKEYGYTNKMAIASEFIKVLIEKDYFMTATIADIIERWVWILLGLKNEMTHIDASATLNFILASILKNQKIKRRNFIQYWREKKMIYIDSLDVDHSSKDDRIIIKRKREILNLLINRFKNTKT